MITGIIISVGAFKRKSSRPTVMPPPTSNTMTEIPRSTNGTDYEQPIKSRAQQGAPPIYVQQHQALQAHPQQVVQGHSPQRAYPTKAYPQQEN